MKTPLIVGAVLVLTGLLMVGSYQLGFSDCERKLQPLIDKQLATQGEFIEEFDNFNEVIRNHWVSQFNSAQTYCQSWYGPGYGTRYSNTDGYCEWMAKHEQTMLYTYEAFNMGWDSRMGIE